MSVNSVQSVPTDPIIVYKELVLIILTVFLKMCITEDLKHKDIDIKKLQCCGTCYYWCYEGVQKYCKYNKDFPSKKREDTCKNWKIFN